MLLEHFTHTALNSKLLLVYLQYLNDISLLWRNAHLQPRNLTSDFTWRSGRFWCKICVISYVCWRLIFHHIFLYLCSRENTKSYHQILIFLCQSFCQIFCLRESFFLHQVDWGQKCFNVRLTSKKIRQFYIFGQPSRLYPSDLCPFIGGKVMWAPGFVFLAQQMMYAAADWIKGIVGGGFYSAFNQPISHWLGRVGSTSVNNIDHVDN